ncbi:hypothetical protein [Lentilactobacillus buchneri]|nr:hypothetical protein [Lentilactobacillus buchneri]WCJ52434.1 hypothetical protein OKF32_03635 [Lentilactobacillus sp. Egmn17]MCT2881516.1 hypothetical protein [Lentilactobacillus buchneri]MCT2898442.1 hypothetical protein [Lentilactobacillus buchneri]MCT3252610.1 hypothetical protein [Lentilactobacillus buchneri]MCT3547204.1 hypothetical protein [Lentilactobacillus buchneri]
MTQKRFIQELFISSVVLLGLLVGTTGSVKAASTPTISELTSFIWHRAAFSGRTPSDRRNWDSDIPN